MRPVEPLERKVVVRIEVDPEIVAVLPGTDIDAMDRTERDVEKLIPLHRHGLVVDEYVHLVLVEAEEELVQHRMVMALHRVDAVGLDASEGEAGDAPLVDAAARDRLVALVAVAVLLRIAVYLNERELRLVLGCEGIVLALALEPAYFQNLGVGQRLDRHGPVWRRHEHYALMEDVLVAVRGEPHLALEEHEDVMAVARLKRPRRPLQDGVVIWRGSGDATVQDAA